MAMHDWQTSHHHNAERMEQNNDRGDFTVLPESCSVLRSDEGRFWVRSSSALNYIHIW